MLELMATITTKSTKKGVLVIMENENHDWQSQETDTFDDPIVTGNSYFANHEPKLFLDEDSAVNVTNSEMITELEE